MPFWTAINPPLSTPQQLPPHSSVMHRNTQAGTAPTGSHYIVQNRRLTHLFLVPAEPLQAGNPPYRCKPPLPAVNPPPPRRSDN